MSTQNSSFSFFATKFSMVAPQSLAFVSTIDHPFQVVLDTLSNKIAFMGKYHMSSIFVRWLTRKFP